VITVTERAKQGAILVSGGRGFIGRAAVKLLRRSGYQVISIDRRRAESGHKGEEAVCDVSDRAALDAVFQTTQIDTIVHLAAMLPTAAQREPALATEINVQGSLNLLEMARQFGVRRFVFGSSLSVYGTWSAEQVVSEADRAAPEDLYGAAKVYVEQLGSTYSAAHGLEFVSLRIGRVVGPGARSSTSAWRSHIFECFNAGGPQEIEIPYAEWERILLVNVEDVARMLVRLVQAGQLEHSLYNAACESVVVGELKAAVERLNPRVGVRLSGQSVMGNPRRVDWSRLGKEFEFQVVPIFEQFAAAASHGRQKVCNRSGC